MTITAAYQWLTDNLHNRAITLDAVSFENDAMFRRILSALARPALELVNCDINMVSGIINVIGEASLANVWLNDAAVIKKQNLVVKLTIRQDGDKLTYEFKAALAGTFTFAQFFGDIAPQFMRGDKDTNGEDKSGFILFLPSNIADFVLINPELSAVSARDDNFDENLPLGISADFKFANTGLWAADFSDIINKNINAKVTGSMSLYPKYERYLPFLLTIKLFGNMEPQAHSLLTSRNNFTNVLPEKVSLAFILQHGLMFSDYDMLESLTITSVFLQFGFQFRNVQTPFYFTTPLFQNPNFWVLTCEMPDGFGIIDLFNFFTGLFGVGVNDGLLLPPSLNINRMKLYALGFGMERSENRLTLTEAQAVLALSEEWELLKGIRLRELSMFWHIQWGGERHLLTGNIAAQVDIDLPGNKLLTLEGRLRIPSLELSASLELSEKADYALANIMGDEAANTLPSKSRLTIAKIDIEASYYERTLSIYAEVHNVLSFKIGHVDINLTELHASAQFAQSGNIFGIGGRVDFYDDTKQDELLFAFSVDGSYSTNDGWHFHGGLSYGEVKIIDLIRRFIKAGGEYKGFDIALTQLDFDYKYKDNKSSYSLLAAFGTGKFHLLGIDIEAAGKIMLTSNEKNENYISAMMRVEFSRLDIVVQADNFNTDNPYYYLQLGFRGHYIMGSYYTNKDKHNLINISFKNLTFGDIVSWIVELVNPNIRYDLPSPWNVLNKIDLSKMNFVINLTTGDVAFQYKINLNILGIATIEYIGIEYNKNNSSIYIIGSAAIAGGTKEQIKFDPITENPPDIAPQKPKTFELSFLGLGQHMSLENIDKANTISDAIAAMESEFFTKEGKCNLTYSDSTNWIFGVDFTVKESLQVKVVINDPNLYGLFVTVKDDNLFPGLKNLKFEVLYKKITKTIGMFKGTLVLPEEMRRLQLGVASVTAGTFGLEIYTNGDFLIDLGFPYDVNFSRSFAFEWGYFTGRGGFYFGLLSGDTCSKLPPVKIGQFDTVLAIGIGLEVGVGRTFDFGIVAGGLTLSVFGIFEGLFATWKSNDKLYLYVKASATIGIIGQVYVRVNLIIIKLEASATITAYATLTMESYRKTDISLDVSIKLKATVKILFIKISVSFNFSKHFGFTIGQNEVAPWEDDRNDLLKRNAILIDNLYTTDSLNENKRELTLSFSPIFSIEAGKKVAAFLAVLKKDEFKKFYDMLVGWTLSNIKKSNDKYTAGDILVNLTDENIEKLTYEQLNEFLNENVEISLEPSPTSNNAEDEGVIIAMPPPLDLKLTAIKEQLENDEEQPENDEVLLEVNYDDAVRVSQSYIDSIASYFESFDDFKEQPKKLNAVNDLGTPLARVLFLDWVKMILKAISHEICNLYKSINITENFDWTGNSYKLEPEQILKDNLNLQLTIPKGKTFTVSERKIVVSSSGTIASIAAAIGINASQLIDDNKKSFSILRNGVKLDVPEFEWKNEKSLTAKIVAAMFFVRHGKFTADKYYRDYFVKLSQKDASPDWVADGTETFTFTVEGVFENYKPICGDTIEILAKVCALINDFEESYADWNTYLEDFLNKNKDATKSFKIPASEVSIEEDKSLTELSNRIYATPGKESEKENIFAEIKLFADNATVKATNSNITFAEDTDIKTILSANNLSIKELADALQKNIGNFTFSGSVVVNNATVLPIEYVLSRAKDVDFVDGLSGAISRFMLQGLRLPTPQANDLSTTALYKLSQQQVGLKFEDKTIKKWECSIYAPDNTWLKGNSNISFTPDDISIENFDWKSLYSKIEKIEYFRQMPKSYPIAGGFICGAQAIHLFSDTLTSNFKNTGAPTVKYKGREIAVSSYGVMLKLSVEIQNGIVIMHGASPKDRITLSNILDILKGKKEIPCKLMYKSSSLNGMADTLIALADTTNSTTTGSTTTNDLLIKTNLSKETHMFAVRAVPNKNDNNTKKSIYVSKFGSIDFLTELWECSVVDGAYYLVFKEPPESSVIEENPYLWLFIQDTGLLKDYVNCLVSAETSLIANNEALDLYSSNATDNDWQPVLAPGNYGITIKSNREIGENDNDAELFSIISYNIESEHYSDLNLIGKESKPLIPIDNEEEKKRQYAAILPLYKDNPYDALGKELTFNISCRDVLGNYADAFAMENIEPSVNDFVIGIHEWFGTALSFDIIVLEKPCIRINLAYLKDEKEISPEAIAIIQRSLYQLQTENISVSLSGSFFKSVELDSEQIKKIIAHGNSIISGRDSAQNIVMEISPVTDENIVALSVNLTVSRGELNIVQSRAKFATSNIRPNISTEKPVLQFATEFENILGVNYKIAAADINQTDLYVVYVENMIPSVEVAPIKHTNSDNTIDYYPEFFAIRPISNKPITRSVDVFPLKNTGELDTDNSKTINYADIDVDMWANRFLSDFENILSPEMIKKLGLTILSSDDMNNLITVKSTLAEAISTYLTAMEEKQIGNGIVSRTVIKDRLLKNLVSGNNISCAAEYEVVTEPKESKPKIRLVAEIKNTNENAGKYTICECKIDLTQNRVCLLITAQSIYETGFTFNNPEVKIRDIEYDISVKGDDYETSKWLRFIVPLTTSKTTDRVKINLKSDIAIPNPLRQVPNVLKISNQESIPSVKSYQWNHKIQCETIAAEQDIHSFEIKYHHNEVLAHGGQTEDLFGVLAQYDFIRTELLSNITNTTTAAYFKTFTKIAGDIAKSWSAGITKNNTLEALKTKGNGKNLRFDAQLKSNSENREIVITNPDKNFTVKSGTPIIENNLCKFYVEVEDLNIYDKNIAETSVQTSRNSNLLGGNKVVNPQFVYQTELSTMQKFPAAISVAEILLNGNYGEMSEDTVKDMLSKVINVLQLSEIPNKASLVVSYNYTLAGNFGLKAQLPVAYFPNIKANLSDSTIAQSVNSWYNATKPSTAGSSLVFDLIVYNLPETRSILQANRIVARINV